MNHPPRAPQNQRTDKAVAKANTAPLATGLSFVLVVGDFAQKKQETSSKRANNGQRSNKADDVDASFGWDAWYEIKAEFLRLIDQSFPDSVARDDVRWSELDPSSGICNDPKQVLTRIEGLLGEQLDKAKKHKTPVPPIPIPFNDRAPWRNARLVFRNLLRCYLRELDILAIISCSPALHAQALLDALRPLEVPVLVTVSSVISLLDNFEDEHRPIPKHLPHVLRLIPSNELQGQAIMERVLGERTPESSSGRTIEKDEELVIFAPDRLSNVYVHDLVRELKQRASERTPPLQLNVLTAYAELRNSNPKHVVSIGYRDTLERLTEEIKKPLKRDGKRRRKGQSGKGGQNNPTVPLIIQSDGCTEGEVEECISGDDPEVFLARPARLHREYARHAYDGIAKVWEAYVRPPSRGWDEPTLRERLFPFVSLVKRYLQQTLPDAYYFLANENQRGGFLIEKVNERNTH